MRVLHIPFGTYVDARPDGRFACLVVDDGPAMQLDTERLTIPRDARPLYVRVPRDGPFKFAGQSSNSPETIEWIEGTGWVPRAVVPCGISPVIYDHASVLHISDCGPAVGSQGYRYVDYDTGALVTGDQTIGSDFGLAEWTYLGDGVYVGQCNVTPGCAVWDGVALRMLEPGDCFFIRGQRVGQDVSVAMVKHAGEPAVIVWATLDELRALPVIPPVEPPIPPIPPDPPIEPPIPPDPPVEPIKPPDPPIQPPIPPDPPIVPPSEVPMPIPPVSSWPFVHQAGKPATPVATTEAYPLPQPQAQPYNDFEIATSVFKEPLTIYVAAYLEGRAMCIGGVAPDVTTGKTVYLFEQARKQRGSANRGLGLLDAWRLYVEHGDVPPAQWVADVIAKM